MTATTAEELWDRLLDAREQRELAEHKERRLKRKAARARADGDEERADELLDELRETRAEIENLTDAVSIVERRYNDRRTAERRSAAQSRVRDINDEAERLVDRSQDARQEAVEKLEEGLSLVQESVQAVSELRVLREEVRLLANLHDLDAEADEVPYVDEDDVFGEFLGEVADHSTTIRSILKRWPRDRGPGRMLRRSVGALASPANGNPSTYGRAKGVRSKVSDVTLEVAEDEIVEKLQEMYDALDPDDRDQARPPRPRNE